MLLPLSIPGFQDMLDSTTELPEDTAKSYRSATGSFLFYGIDAPEAQFEIGIRVAKLKAPTE